MDCGKRKHPALMFHPHTQMLTTLHDKQHFSNKPLRFGWSQATGWEFIRGIKVRTTLYRIRNEKLHHREERLSRVIRSSSHALNFYPQTQKVDPPRSYKRTEDYRLSRKCSSLRSWHLATDILERCFPVQYALRSPPPRSHNLPIPLLN